MEGRRPPEGLAGSPSLRETGYDVPEAEARPCGDRDSRSIRLSSMACNRRPRTLGRGPARASRPPVSMPIAATKSGDRLTWMPVDFMEQTRRAGSPARPSARRVNATKRRETADFEVASPDAAGRPRRPQRAGRRHRAWHTCMVQTDQLPDPLHGGPCTGSPFGFLEGSDPNDRLLRLISSSRENLRARGRSTKVPLCRHAKAVGRSHAWVVPHRWPLAPAGWRRNLAQGKLGRVQARTTSRSKTRGPSKGRSDRRSKLRSDRRASLDTWQADRMVPRKSVVCQS